MIKALRQVFWHFRMDHDVAIRGSDWTSLFGVVSGHFSLRFRPTKIFRLLLAVIFVVVLLVHPHIFVDRDSDDHLGSWSHDLADLAALGACWSA